MTILPSRPDFFSAETSLLDQGGDAGSARNAGASPHPITSQPYLRSIQDHPDAPLEFRNASMRGGRKPLIEHWKRQRDEGVNHVALHMKPLRRPFEDALAELAEHVLPAFAD